MSNETNNSYLDHDSIYTECVHYQPSNFESVVQCDPLLFSGFMSGALIPVTALWFILFGLIAIIKFIALPKLYGNQKLFGSYFLITDVLIFTVVGFLFLFCIRGLAWMELAGYYVHNESNLKCRIMHFLMALANITPANVLFFTNLNAWLSTLLPGYDPIRTSIQLIVICFILSLVYAIPEILVNQLWQFDGQYYCGTNPGYARLVLFHAELHRVLYGHGFVQATLSLICLLRLIDFNSKLSQSKHYLLRIATLRNAALSTIRQISLVLHQIELVMKLIIVHSFLLSILILIRVLTHIWISFELYKRVHQLPRVQAHFRLYSYWATRDQLSWAIMILGCYHLWFYWWYFPRMTDIELNNPSGESKILPGLDPTITLNHWEQVLSVLEEIDTDNHPEVEVMKSKLRHCIQNFKSRYRI